MDIDENKIETFLFSSARVQNMKNVQKCSKDQKFKKIK